MFILKHGFAWEGKISLSMESSLREFIQSEIQRNEDTKSGKELLPLLSEAQGWKRDRRARLFENRHKGVDCNFLSKMN